MNTKNKIYLLNSIIDDDTIVNIGIFTSKKELNKVKNRWKNSNLGIKFEFYIKELILNEDDLFLNPQFFIEQSKLQKVKEFIRNEKLNQLIKS